MSSYWCPQDTSQVLLRSHREIEQYMQERTTQRGQREVSRIGAMRPLCFRPGLVARLSRSVNQFIARQPSERQTGSQETMQAGRTMQ